MSRIEFMRELERLLSDIPLDERNEAIQYYNDYFEDAGQEHEEEIIKELGTPSRIAGIIKADINLNVHDQENRGYFTEKGYQDTVYSDEKYELIRTAKTSEDKRKSEGDTGYSEGKAESTGTYNEATEGYTGNQTGGTNQRANNTNLLLIILLAFFGMPVIFSVFGIVFGLIAVCFGIMIGFGIAGVAMMGAGVALFILGLIQISIPVAIMALCGSGLLLFGLGILFLMFSMMLGKRVIPSIIRGIVSLCRIPFKNRSVTV